MFASAHPAPFELLIPSVRHDFKVLAFDGKEAVSCLYAIRVELVSEHPDFDLHSLLRQPAFLRFGFKGEGLHGCIEEVAVGQTGKRLTHYCLTLVPVLHYLQFSHNQRIFQNMTVPQIVTQVLKEHWVLADVFSFKVSTSPVREYCTQYGESDFEFIQRLCSEDGISWHHEHSPQGHMLRFKDNHLFSPKLEATRYHPGSGQVAETPVIDQFSMRLSTRTGKTARRDYDFTRPGLLREGRASQEGSPELEDYRYPVPINSDAQGEQLAQQALERHRVDYQLAQGHSDQPTLRSGYFFDLAEHPRPSHNGLWMLLSVTHCAKQPQVLEESGITYEPSAQEGFTQGYRNTFSAIPWDVPYRPPLVKRPSVSGSQTARVTGPAGEEIFCDEHGRVCVEFHWDRAERGSDKSSCWLRVASSWAGDGFGAVTIPRVGMEVVVTYLEGNPDQPLITGCVPNTLTPVPYALPAHKTRTVLRSHSSPHNGGYNELSIEDRSGQEQIYLRAQRDLQQHIGHDSRLEVGNERHETIKGNSVTVLEAEEQHTVHADRKVDLRANDFLQLAGNSHTRAGQTVVVEAGQQVHLKAGAELVLDAGASITLKAGGQHLVINPKGIFTSTAIALGGVPAVGTPAAPVLPGMLEGLSTPAALPLPNLAFYRQQLLSGVVVPNACCELDVAGQCPVHLRGQGA